MDGETQHASSATPAAHAADGALTLGDYALSARLARRPSADVYEATHTPTGAPRLVYVLRPGAMQDHPLVHRVVCEVDAARWLRHPAIAKVDGYGDTPSRRLYLGVERAPGRTLRELLADGERIPAWRVARLASRLVEALDEAHAVGLTHGRLTPDVVVLAPEAEAAGSPPLVTLVGLGAGAVAFDGPIAAADRPYLSPEQLAGGDADARSDVFGLASLLHHLLAGHPPAEVAAGAAYSQATGPTAAVLAAARAADPRRRPASVKAFWEELLAALVADAAAAASLGAHAPVAAPRAAAPAALDADVLHALELEVLDLDLEMAPAVSVEPTPDALPTSEPVAAPVAVAPVPASVAPPVAVAPPAPRVYPTERPAPLRPRQYDRDEPVAPPVASAVPSRRRRVLVAVAWCVAVPAVAAAVGWPLAYGGSPARDARMGETAVEILADAPPPPAVPSSTDSLVGPAPKVHRAALPAVPAVDIPAVDLPTVDVAPRRPLVRADEFTKRITSADSLR